MHKKLDFDNLIAKKLIYLSESEISNKYTQFKDTEGNEFVFIG